MYNNAYFILFYAFALLGAIIVIFFLYIVGVFKKNTKKEEKSTLAALIDKIKASSDNKEALDSVMNEFYSNYYTISKASEDFEQWIELIKNITMIDYMNVEKVAKFRDGLINKNPSIKQEIIYAVGTSLKYREEKNRNG